MLEAVNDTDIRKQPLLFESGDPQKALLLIRCSVWIVTILAGFVQAWSLRFSLSPDANSYLEIASYYLRGDYANAINAYWSPMFSWLIAVGLKIFHPSTYWETAFLHLLNFGGLLIALRCFEFFFVSFLVILERSRRSSGKPLLEETHWWLLGYALFFSTSLFVLTMEATTPDIWVCVFSYLAMGILLRIATRPEKTAYFALFGFVLGLGYLTKSFYFPLAFVFLIVVGLIARPSRQHFARVFFALCVFALVSGPFIFEISKAEHRLTFGDAGKITYAEFVNPINQPQFWQGDGQNGVPKHPTRKILSNPSVFEYATPVGELHPRYDLSYWMDGVSPHFNVRGQLRILRQSVGTFFGIFLVQLEFAVGLIIFLLVREQRRDCLSSARHLWPLWVPSLVGCVAYALVLVEPRYVAPFLVFLWLAAFAVVARQSASITKRAALATVLGILCVTGIKTTKYFISDFAAMGHQENVYWQVAHDLHGLGIQTGDRVAIIGGKAGAHWARLAGVKIAAELPPGQEDIFWKEGRPTQARVYAAFAGTGSRVVVVKDPPADVTRDDWHQLGDTPYYAHLLPSSP